MTIKILGGQLSGLSLYVPKGKQTRPTSVMLRRKLFDAHQNLSHKLFYDFCAGTGAMGLEACSREAKSVVFIENHPSTMNSLKKNIQLARERMKANQWDCQLFIFKSKLQSYLSEFKRKYIKMTDDDQKNTILFLDPPYDQINIYDYFFKEIFLDNWFNGTCWVEIDFQKGFNFSSWEKKGFKAEKNYRHGDSAIFVFIPKLGLEVLA